MNCIRFAIRTCCIQNLVQPYIAYAESFVTPGRTQVKLSVTPNRITITLSVLEISRMQMGCVLIRSHGQQSEKAFKVVRIDG